MKRRRPTTTIQPASNKLPAFGRLGIARHFCHVADFGEQVFQTDVQDTGGIKHFSVGRIILCSPTHKRHGDLTFCACVPHGEV